MKTLKVLVLALVVSSLGFFVSQAHAAGFYASADKGTASIAADKTVDGAAYLTGDHIVVDGTVKGDVYCAGNEIHINGTVEGDVLCGGKNLTIGGTIKGDIRVAGSSVTVRGNIAGNATIAASDGNVTKEAIIGGDITGGVSTFVMDGSIGRDMLIGSGTTVLGGTVGRDVNAGIDTLTVNQGARVGGNLTYQGNTEATVPAGVVAGKTQFTKVENKAESASSKFSYALGFIVAFIILALLVTLVMPKYIHEASTITVRRALLAFLAGFAALILIPLASVILMSTIIGIPAGVVGIIVWALFIFLSSVFFAYYVGTLVLKKRARNALVVAMVGALIVGIALFIPVLNILVFMIALCVGIGMQLLHIQNQFSKHPYKIES